MKRLFEHLDKVTDYEELNQMTSHSLSIVIGPNILRAPRDDFAVTMSNMGQAHSVTRALISHVRTVHIDAPIILTSVPRSAMFSSARWTSRRKTRMAMIMTSSMTKIPYQKAVRKRGVA